jgi:hypothetical protein
VSAALRVISHRISMPGWKSSWRSPLADLAAGSPPGVASLLISETPDRAVGTTLLHLMPIDQRRAGGDAVELVRRLVG